jgi:hypothetical protein
MFAPSGRLERILAEFDCDSEKAMYAKGWAQLVSDGVSAVQIGFEDARMSIEFTNPAAEVSQAQKLAIRVVEWRMLTSS